MTTTDTDGNAGNATSFRVRLSQLFLDPNNYRFIDHEEYAKVPGQKELDVNIQKRTAHFILGKNQENVRDLLDSFKKNGWLPVDQIQVREIAADKYLVIEGNRRVATLRHLHERLVEANIDLGALDAGIFEAVPVNAYPDKDASHHLVLMGLKHISGNKKWPALNQAKLLRSLRDAHGMSADEICRAVAIRKQEFNVSMRTLAMCEAYQSSEYGDQFHTSQFNLFQEIVKSSGVKRWINWNDVELRADNTENLGRLFSLISTDAGLDDEDADHRPTDPAISTSAQIREFSKLIDDPEALKNLERTRSLTEAALSSDILVTNQVQRGIAIIDDQIRVLSNHARSLKDFDLDEIQRLDGLLRGVALAKGREPELLGSGVERAPFQTIVTSHFSSITIASYKKLQDLTLSGLRRVNLIAGINNAGKTSLLEGILLLTQQHEVSALLEMARRRGKIQDNPNPAWLALQIPEYIAVSGIFDTIADNRASLTVQRLSDPTLVEDQGYYVASLLMTASYVAREQSSETHLFANRDRRTTYTGGNRILCPTVLSSPFSAQDAETLLRYHAKATEGGGMADALEFIRTKIDSKIESISLVAKKNEPLRFVVNHSDFPTAVDLTQFGEGLQRVFHILLLFAYASNGVVLIDEMENALHASLLGAFAEMIHAMAEKFNVQVFLTSHSKECIDAFIKGSTHLSDLSAHALGKSEAGVIFVRSFSGERLHELVELYDADLRAAK